VILNLEAKKRQLSDKFESGLNLLNISKWSNKGLEVVLYNAMKHEIEPVENLFYLINRFNVGKIESRVNALYNSCLTIHKTINEINDEKQRIYSVQADAESKLYSLNGLVNQTILDSIKGKFHYEVNKAIEAIHSNWNHIPGKYKRNWKGMLYKSAEELKLFVNEEFRRAEQLNERKRIENENLEKEKTRISTQTAANASIEKIRQEYEQKRNKDLEQFEKDKKRIEKEFYAQMEQKVKEALDIDIPRIRKELEAEVLRQQNHIIEEEISRRMKKEIAETLKRKEAISNEEIELHSIKFEKEVTKLELKYKQVIEELKMKINFLDNHLKETILKYEKTFTEKHQDEIEKRAKTIAKDYLKNEFPFE